MAAQSARLYVGGYLITSPTEKLEEIFKKYGTIRDIKRNRNFSFIQFGSEKEAKAAIEGEYGKSYFGKSLDVQIAKHSRSSMRDRDDKDCQGPPQSLFPGGQFGGNFDAKRDEGFRDGSPGGFRSGRPGGPPTDERFEPSFGGPGGGYNAPSGPGGFDRGPPGAPPGFNGQSGPPRGGPSFGGPPPRTTPSRYDEPPAGGFRDMPGPGDRYGGPPGGGRGYGGVAPGQGPGPGPGYRGPMDRPGEHPPTQPPGPLAISHENRTNDVEIIVINKGITDYGEFIEQKLKALAFTVDLLFPNEEVPLRRVLANIASRGTLYAVLVTPQHRDKRSLTLNILHGAPQEHRNMLVDDAVTLISRNYEMYAMQTAEKNRDLPPEDVRMILQQLIQGRQISVPQIDKLQLYLNQCKARSDSLDGPGSAPPPHIMPPMGGPPHPVGNLGQPNKSTSLQETELQNRILNILNKGGSGGPGQQSNVGPPPLVGVPPPSGLTSGKAPPPLLNDPSVQKAIDNLIQGDIFKAMPPTNPNPIPPRLDFPPNRY